MKITPTMIQLPSPTGNGYDDEWTIKLPGGYIYHSIEMETNLVKKKTIKKVTVDIGGTPVAYASGAIMEVKDKAYQKFEQDGRLVMDLAKLEGRSSMGIYRTSLFTGLGDDITLKVDFGTKDAADPATPIMRAKAWVSINPGQKLPQGGRQYLPIMKALTLDAPDAGDYEWHYQGSANRHLQRMFIDESNVTISKVFIKRGRTTIRELTRTDIEFALQRQAGVALQPGFLILDFAMSGFLENDAMNTEGLNFVFVTSGAGAMKAHIEGFERVA